jgi:dehydrogenase/reductase SDR family protein 12
VLLISWQSMIPAQLIGRALGLLRDASVVYSFDASGFAAHQRNFQPDDLAVDLAGKRILITGANAGIGLEIARGLCRLNAEVTILCRRPAAGKAALEQLRQDNPRTRLQILDVSSLAAIRSFAASQQDPLHAIVHNAGVLNEERQLTAEGIEVTFATHVVGPFLLTHLLLPLLGDSGRVITVSSGGMYPMKLDVDELERGSPDGFDGLRAYALAKRAQVVLAEMWAEKMAGRALRFDVMHPGWADTMAVRGGLPRFYKLMHQRLRSPAEGADTAVWLAAARNIPGGSGRFWFDRRTQPKHVVPWTRESKKQRGKLWATCERLSGAAR